jgi:hypothetical protein
LRRKLHINLQPFFLDNATLPEVNEYLKVTFSSSEYIFECDEGYILGPDKLACMDVNLRLKPLPTCGKFTDSVNLHSCELYFSVTTYELHANFAFGRISISLYLKIEIIQNV